MKIVVLTLLNIGLLLLFIKLFRQKNLLSFNQGGRVWLTFLAIGVMVFNLMRLPRLFPQFAFDITYSRKPVPVQNRESE